MQILFIGRLISLLTVVAIAVGVATSAVPRGSTVEPAAAELPFARSRDGVRETYIVSFGLFGPESVFASEAQKAAQILRARLQGEAQVLVRFNDKRGGNATSATLSAALRSAGQAMVPGALADRRTLVITAAAPDRPSFGCEDGATWTYFGDAFFNQAFRGARTLDDAFCRARDIVARRERREGFEPSEPQMNGGSEVLKLLGGARRETPTVHLERRRSLGKVPVRANQCAPMVPLAVATIQRPPRRTMD